MTEFLTSSFWILLILVVLGVPVVAIVWVVNRFFTRWLPWFMERREATAKEKIVTLAATTNKPQKKDPPASLQNLHMWNNEESTKTTTFTTPIITSVEEPEEEPVEEASIRIYRIYRSVDQKNWAECDPALTERAACNYGAYIKRQNPTEYVRVEDPDGLILFYE
jgi:hypothetical protein